MKKTKEFSPTEVGEVTIFYSVHTGKFTYHIPKTWTGDRFTDWKNRYSQEIHKAKEFILEGIIKG